MLRAGVRRLNCHTEISFNTPVAQHVLHSHSLPAYAASCMHPDVHQLSLEQGCNAQMCKIMLLRAVLSSTNGELTESGFLCAAFSPNR